MSCADIIVLANITVISLFEEITEGYGAIFAMLKVSGLNNTYILALSDRVIQALCKI